MTDGTLIITLSNGETKSLGNIKGEKGEPGEKGADGAKGDKGDTGRGIESIEFNANGELVVLYTDGTTQNLGVIPESPQIFKYELLSNNTYSVSAGDDSYEMDTILIPETYKGKAVTEIAENGFSGNNNWVSITIPESIVKIGSSAFSNCKATITICPTALKTIGKNAFSKSSTIIWNSNEISTWKCSVDRNSYYRRVLESGKYIYSVCGYGDYTVYRNITVKDGNMQDMYFSKGSSEDYEQVGNCSNSNYSSYYTTTVYYSTCEWVKID